MFHCKRTRCQKPGVTSLYTLCLFSPALTANLDISTHNGTLVESNVFIPSNETDKLTKTHLCKTGKSSIINTVPMLQLTQCSKLICCIPMSFPTLLQTVPCNTRRSSLPHACCLGGWPMWWQRCMSSHTGGMDGTPLVEVTLLFLYPSLLVHGPEQYSKKKVWC